MYAAACPFSALVHGDHAARRRDQFESLLTFPVKQHSALCRGVDVQLVIHRFSSTPFVRRVSYMLRAHCQDLLTASCDLSYLLHH